jgi:hypothetical protein
MQHRPCPPPQALPTRVHQLASTGPGATSPTFRQRVRYPRFVKFPIASGIAPDK